MPSTSMAWEAAVNGNPGNLNATNHAAQINQFMGTHVVTPIYEGSRIITPVGGTAAGEIFPGNGLDIAQAFVMPGGKTTIGRVSVPLHYYGSGSDVVVSLLPQASGNPDFGNILARSIVPASWLTNLTSPTGLSNGGPLCAPQNHNYAGAGNIPGGSWGSVTVDSSGVSVGNQAVETSGNYFISAGGLTSGVTGAVITAQFISQGVLASPMLQPSLPQASYFGMLAATDDSLVYAGGNTNPTLTANVYTASWDPLTGEMGAWSAQAALPLAIQNGQATASGNTVYVVGGVDGSNNVQNTVYYANVSNGQISTWLRGPVLPVAVQQAAVSVINGWLIVAGGSTTGGVNTATSNVWYAKVKSNGSLGNWVAGPSLPTAVWAWGPGWNQALTGDGFNFVGGLKTGGSDSNLIQTLEVGPNGPGDYWKNVTAFSGAAIIASFSLSNGAWNLFSLNFGGSSYSYTLMNPISPISVPLYATGLTPGNTYYIMIQQHQYNSSSDFISFTASNGALSSDYIKRNRNAISSAWATGNTGFSIPIVVYDTTFGGQVLHTWEDTENTGSGWDGGFAGRTTSLIYGGHNNLIGYADSTILPNDTLNANPTFTTGVSNWTAHNCTFVQSNAQTHGGFPFSGLMTPNGVAAAPNVTSDQVLVHPALVSFGSVVWVQANGWFYSPTGYGNVSLSVDWYDVSHVFISTTSNATTIGAATWTNLVSYYQPPASALYASINVVEAGTPAAGNTLFFSNVRIMLSPEQTTSHASIAQITYPGTLDTWPPSGVVQLA